MKRENKSIAYSFESGDETLPHLRELVSENPDPEKTKILRYLKTHCILACAGMIQDEITSGKIIGYGNIYSDGTFFWDDVFTNYVDQYNIPVPKDFRQHLLKNYERRMGLHTLLHRIDSVEIHNNPYLGFIYDVRICRNGVVKYKNNVDCADGAVMFIQPKDAQYIITSIMSELFCYDTDEHGSAMIDGYHWKLSFYIGDNAVKEIEGFPNEDKWRYNEAKNVIEFAERYVKRELGTNQMNF